MAQLTTHPSQIRTLAAERIGQRLGKASPEELTQVIDGLTEIIGP